MTPDALTLIAPIKPGFEQELRARLIAIGEDVKGKDLAAGRERPHIDFQRSPHTHFARLVILPDVDSGAERYRLLFAAVYDGSLNDYLLELVNVTSGMDEIWGTCEDYRGADRFSEFVEHYSIRPHAFYRAFPNQPAESVREFAASRDRFDSRRFRQSRTAEESKPSGSIPAPSDLKPSPVRRWVFFLRKIPGLSWGLFRIIISHGLIDVFFAAREISATLNRLGWPVRWFNRLTFNGMTPLTTIQSQATLDGCKGCRPATPDDEVVDLGEQLPLQRNREDQVAQNQLTLVTVNDPRRVGRQRAVMALIDFYSRYLAPPGALAGISTIHFVRWTVIDGGKRLIMISDYDGTWEAYIEEFAEMILSGLDAIWRRSRGFPENGARDVLAFKQFLRCRQYQAQVFYSGYPRQTVLNISDNRRIAEFVRHPADAG